MVWSLTLQKCLDFVGIYAMHVPVYAETHDQLRTHTLLACRDRIQILAGVSTLVSLSEPFP